MVSGNERPPRSWPLTRRLVAALAVGSLFVALVLGFFGAERDAQRALAAAERADTALATSLAERAAPLLERLDVMRLSVLAAVVRDQGNGRALVLDQHGRVVIDTALLLGDRQLGLRATAGTLQRTVAQEGGALRETSVPVRFGGEVFGEVRLQVPVVAAASAFDVTWFGLVFLGCLTLVAGAAMLGHHWSTRVRTATDSLIRLAAGEAAGESPAGGDAELQDLGSAMRELERGMHEGLDRVGEGYVTMALLLVDSLESRQLCVPGHGERTAALAASLAERTGMLPADRDELDLACRLVDLGKASVRPSILTKQGPLTEVEQQSLQHHPVRAAEMLACVPSLRRVGKILRHQLERHDGKGCPDGLRGDRIPLAARILTIAAAFDLLTAGAADRSLAWRDALAELGRAGGEVFDPWLLELLADEVAKNPPVAGENEVMIVPTGAMPWRAAVTAPRDDDDDDGVDDRELEVLLDERRREDHP